MYKFKENIILDDVKRYIDQTYNSHYSSTKKQATEIIIDQEVLQVKNIIRRYNETK